MEISMNNKIKVVFTLSLIANIFLLGWFAGYVFNRHDGFLLNSQSPRGHLSRMLFSQEQGHHGAGSKVDLQTKNLIRSAFKEKRKDIRAALKESRERKEELANIFTNNDFNADLYNKKVEELLAADNKISRYKYEILGDLAKDLPLDSRSKLSGLLLSNKFKNMTDRHQKRSNHSEGKYSFSGK